MKIHIFLFFLVFLTAQAVNPSYPGTALDRTEKGKELASQLQKETLNGDWASLVRPSLLQACGLRDKTTVRPGNGYTGHCFNDYNHVDCCTMIGEVAHNENNGQVQGIAYSNPLGKGILSASIPSNGEGGSWCTCQLGSGNAPPADVCHIQFQSQIAFKLVWCKSDDYRSFTLVDDVGELLAYGEPSGRLPSYNQRKGNYRVVEGSKYAVACDNLGSL